MDIWLCLQSDSTLLKMRIYKNLPSHNWKSPLKTSALFCTQVKGYEMKANLTPGSFQSFLIHTLEALAWGDVQSELFVVYHEYSGDQVHLLEVVPVSQAESMFLLKQQLIFPKFD